MSSKKNGFTLIEVLVYLTLFSIIIGGAMVTVYHIIEGNAFLRAKTLLQEEGSFILAKLNWALNGAMADTVVITPSVGGVSSSLVVQKKPTNTIKSRADLNNDNIRFDSGGGNFLELNSDRVKVSSLVFRQPTAGEIEIKLTLSTISDQGKQLQQSFEITRYLKR